MAAQSITIRPGNLSAQERAALPRGSPAGTNPAGVRASLQRARPRAVTGQLDAGEFSGEVFGRSQYYSHFSPTLAPQRARKTNGPAGITCRAAMLMREGKKNYNNHFLPLSVLLQMTMATTATMIIPKM